MYILVFGSVLLLLLFILYDDVSSIVVDIVSDIVKGILILVMFFCYIVGMTRNVVVDRKFVVV